MGFIEQIAPYIQKYAPIYGINVCSPIIAQAVLESGGGTSELAKNAHNYFGLKYRAGRCPTSCGIYNKVGSEQNKDGSYISSAMKWMKFSNMEDGVHGYFDFINISNYANLKGVTDPKKYLENIKKDGYATSLKYVDNLIDIINKHNLTIYDSKGSEKIMGYSNSSLVNYTKISPNRTSPRNHAIDTITIHCMAGNLSVETCGNVFAPASRKASSNYGIGSDGRIALYVDERDRSWCSSNAANDNRAITIEVANDGGAPDWHVSDKAMASLINLVVDICKRNNIKKLIWSTNKNNRVNHLNGCNMTVHRDFAAKSCPGNYLYNKHSYIAEQVNAKLGSNVSSNIATSSSNSGKYVFGGISYALVFDPTYYANKYSDLKKAFGSNSVELFNHFCTYGMKEGRVASANFNVTVYKNNYADLRNAFGNNLPLYYKHYITNGYAEKRKCV